MTCRLTKDLAHGTFKWKHLRRSSSWSATPPPNGTTRASFRQNQEEITHAHWEIDGQNSITGDSFTERERALPLPPSNDIAISLRTTRVGPSLRACLLQQPIWSDDQIPTANGRHCRRFYGNRTFPYPPMTQRSNTRISWNYTHRRSVK